MDKPKLYTLEFVFRTDVPIEKRPRMTSLEGRPGVTIDWPKLTVKNAQIVDNGVLLHYRTADGFNFFWNAEAGSLLVESFTKTEEPPV
ncbi:MAG: hypothetical protein QG551_257 [Patescibacteria group bacterium]|nr:hypothetical protein [Patescibacteria group bacterium]